MGWPGCSNEGRSRADPWGLDAMGGEPYRIDDRKAD